jgi:hypothetical protein
MLNRLVQRLLLVLLATFSALSFAKPNSTEPPALCPENYTEQLNTATFADAQLLVCVSQNEINGLKQLQVSFINAKQPFHSILYGSAPLDVEGDLRAIRLASAPYALKPGLRAVALVLALRNRGVGFDEERQELWLFWPKDNALNLVFNQTIELQRWATNCTQDCEDTLQSRSELVVLSQSSGPRTASSELVPLELRIQDHVTPADVGGKNAGEVDTNEAKADTAKKEHFQRTERYEFNGERYELVPERR